MAKTRIKTTPTRMQKEALMASAAVTTTTNLATEHVFKKRISVLKNSIYNKEKSVPTQTSIIVQPPKRTNSISSTTSTISHTSDGHYSCADSPPPNSSNAASPSSGPTMDELTESAIKTLNAGLLAKSNALALKNRKVYMITEKFDDTSNTGHASGNGTSGTNGTTIGPGQKRKMYLIMEENDGSKNHGDHAEKLIKSENSNGSKKLTLFTDTNGQLPQKFEQILPEILNCIQSKNILTTDLNGPNIRPAVAINNNNNNNNSKFQLKSDTENNERLPLTLPPKKNRTKIITTQIIPVNPSQHAIYQANGIDNWSATPAGVVVSSVGATPSAFPANTNSISTSFSRLEKSSSATPVIVNASSLLANNGNLSVAPPNGHKSKENGNSSTKPPATQLHKNINLSTDFLFLMKMLPKLESIEEAHKSYVKTCIEDVINQYAPHQTEEQ